MTSSAPARRPRRDAQRNRAAILEAARTAFAGLGLEAPMDAIAKRAGIGAGTLYRHFPTREDLVAAVLEEHRVDLDRRADELAEREPDPTAALEAWLDVLEEWMTVYEGLPAPLRAAQAGQCSPLRSSCTTAIARTEEFLARAQAAGVARDDVAVGDLFLATLGLAWAAEQTRVAGAESAAGEEPTGGAESPAGADPTVGGASALRRLLRTGWAV